MAENTSIEWADATWNWITGCSLKSPGCTNCYAMRQAGGWAALAQHPSRAGLTRMINGHYVWTGEVRRNEQWLTQPLKWKKPKRIFVCAHGDLFHENVPDAWIDEAFAVMAIALQHEFQILTKRSDRMKKWAADHGRLSRVAQIMAQMGYGEESMRLNWPLPNVWMGVSVEDQTRADKRIPDLLRTPAAVRWISAEPLLGPIDLTKIWKNSDECIDALDGIHWTAGCGSISSEKTGCPRLDWVVAGGESGKSARPMHPDWVRSLRDQCQVARVAFLFKQWGEWEIAIDRERDDPDWQRDYGNAFGDHGKTHWLNLAGGRGFHGERFHVMRKVGKKASGRLLDGVTHDGYPEVIP